MILRILLVAPEQPHIDAIPELRAITSLHQVMVLSGRVTAHDVYQEARRASYHIVHFATHALDRILALSDGESFTPEDVAQVGQMAGCELVFFNTCRSGLLASYTVRHGVTYAVFANIEVPDKEAWKMPSAFYEFLADQADGPADYATAFYRADPGQGVYGLALSPQIMACWQSILDELKHHSEDIARLRRDIDRFVVSQRVMLAVLVVSAAFSVAGLFVQ